MTPIEKRAQELYPVLTLDTLPVMICHCHLNDINKINELKREAYITASTEWKAEADRLREALCELMKGIDGLPPLSAISGVLTNKYNQAKAAITDYDNKVKL